MKKSDYKLKLNGRVLDLSKRTLLMGILNVTPDSFFDGGRYPYPASALKRARRMVSDGADIIDVGGESSRPGAKPVSIEEERRRVIPVIRQLAGKLGVPVSIDTYKAQIAREAISAGAGIINDISALRMDKDMVKVAAAAEVMAIVAEAEALIAAGSREGLENCMTRYVVLVV